MFSKLTVGAFAVFALLAALIDSSGSSTPKLPGSAGNGDGGGMLVGPVTEEQLYRAYPSWAGSASRYRFTPEVIDQLRKIDSKLEIVVFFGTWCGDSRSEVPKFLRVFDTAANGNFSLRMYGVDRSLRDGNGLSESLGVERVPTFIFFSGGKELGRIVEKPRKTIEEDFLAIVSGAPPASTNDGDPDDDEEDSEFA